MRNLKSKFLISVMTLFIVGGVALGSLPAAAANKDNRAPELPSPLCDTLNVPQGNKVSFHAYARGVQIYRWTGTAWAFVAPSAVLFANANYNGHVGIHYAGPTWESNSGSKVTALREFGCSPDSSAIPWLRLAATSTSGPGIFGSASYVQRINTTGGLSRATPGAFTDEVIEVPYTAEYYFYRAED